jgi:hypothetical protein
VIYRHGEISAIDIGHRIYKSKRGSALTSAKSSRVSLARPIFRIYQCHAVFMRCSNVLIEAPRGSYSRGILRAVYSHSLRARFAAGINPGAEASRDAGPES